MSCSYAQIFAPSQAGSGPSGLADWPRPFVFRATHLDGLTFEAGAPFHFDMNLFVVDSQAMKCLILAFEQLAHEGLGAERRKVELTDVSHLDKHGARSTNAFLELDLAPAEVSVDQLRIRFLTPTELKSGQQLATRPDFGILAARARDRISTLRMLYGSGPLPIDFRAFGERAAAVRMTRCEIRIHSVVRRSSRTGQTHPIGGFVGEAEYEGNLAEFVPYLQAAKWTGVGRQTVWGKGEIAVDLSTERNLC